MLADSGGDLLEACVNHRKTVEFSLIETAQELTPMQPSRDPEIALNNHIRLLKALSPVATAAEIVDIPIPEETIIVLVVQNSICFIGFFPCFPGVMSNIVIRRREYDN